MNEYSPFTMLRTACLLLTFCKLFSCQDERWGVSDYLHEVDDSISNWLKDPTLKSKKEIFEMVGDYLETLQDFIEKIDLRRKTALVHGEILLRRKQPRYLEIPFPEDVLKADHNWREVDIDDFQRLLKETDLLWQDFDKSFADMKKAIAEGEEPTSDNSAGIE